MTKEDILGKSFILSDKLRVKTKEPKGIVYSINDHTNPKRVSIMWLEDDDGLPGYKTNSNYQWSEVIENIKYGDWKLVCDNYQIEFLTAIYNHTHDYITAKFLKSILDRKPTVWYSYDERDKLNNIRDTHKLRLVP